MSKEAIKLALEALEAGEYYIDDLEAIVYASDDLGTHEDRAKMQAAITALREALAEPDFWEGYVPEPVKPAQPQVRTGNCLRVGVCASEGHKIQAQRTWVGLADDEIYSVLENLQVMYNRPPTTDSRIIFARAIEAKLKEKNNG